MMLEKRIANRCRFNAIITISSLNPSVYCMLWFWGLMLSFLTFFVSFSMMEIMEDLNQVVKGTTLALLNNTKSVFELICWLQLPDISR
jgi:hypothetical protein